MRIRYVVSLVLFLLTLTDASFAQSTDSSGYIIIQHIQGMGSSNSLTILTPNRNLENVEIPRISGMSILSESARRDVNLQSLKVLELLELYRKKGYELIAVSNEWSGIVTSYILKRKEIPDDRGE